MYNSVKEVPDEVALLPLKVLLQESEKWNIPKNIIMKKRRTVKSKIYARISRIKKKNDYLKEIKVLKEENTKLKIMLENYNFFMNDNCDFFMN